jgi:hypothetical protein
MRWALSVSHVARWAWLAGALCSLGGTAMAQRGPFLGPPSLPGGQIPEFVNYNLPDLTVQATAAPCDYFTYTVTLSPGRGISLPPPPGSTILAKVRVFCQDPASGGFVALGDWFVSLPVTGGSTSATFQLSKFFGPLPHPRFQLFLVVVDPDNERRERDKTNNMVSLYVLTGCG